MSTLMMEQAAHVAKVFPLKELPCFYPQAEVPKSKQILVYFRRLLRKTASNRCVWIPSMAELALFFESTHTEVHEALRALRKGGYDYLLPGLYGQISLLRTDQPFQPASQEWEWLSRAS